MEQAKFQRFKTNILQKPFHILEGKLQASPYNSSDGTSGADCVDFETSRQTA